MPPLTITVHKKLWSYTLIEILCFIISIYSVGDFSASFSAISARYNLGSSFMEPTSLSPRPSPSMYVPGPHEQEQGGNISLIVIVAAIVCLVVCALGLNTMLTCILHCANHTLRQTAQWVALRGLNSGMKKKDMAALPISTYRNSSSTTSACAVCLVDFSNGDKIRVLPNCAHKYHVTCIDKWLLSHSSCPTCRHQLKCKDSVTSVDHIV